MLAAITAGRSEKFGAVQALASRYTSFSVVAVVSIYAMLAKAALGRRLGRRRPSMSTVLFVSMSVVVLLSAAVSYPKGIEAGSKEKAAREKAAFVLYTYESQPDEALTERLNPRAKVVRERAPVLQELGYNVFAEGQAPDLPPPPSSLSPVASPTPYAFAITGPGTIQRNGSLVVPKEASYVKVSGWAIDTDDESTAGGVYVDVDGKLFPAFYGVDRQDVVDSFGVQSYRRSGFERYIPISEIGTGVHRLSVVILMNDQERYYQPDQQVALEVR